MALHCNSHFSEAIQSKEISNANYLTLLVEHKQELIAYAQMRWNGSPSCVVAESPGEISRLYVDSHWHGKGLAQDLMLACLECLGERNCDVVWLGVWENNPKAIAFYTKLGFNEIGSHEFMLGNDCQRDLIMLRPVK